MSNCRFGVSPVNYPDPDPEGISTLEILIGQTDLTNQVQRGVGRRDKC